MVFLGGLSWDLMEKVEYGTYHKSYPVIKKKKRYWLSNSLWKCEMKRKHPHSQCLKLSLTLSLTHTHTHTRFTTPAWRYVTSRHGQFDSELWIQFEGKCHMTFAVKCGAQALSPWSVVFLVFPLNLIKVKMTGPSRCCWPGTPSLCCYSAPRWCSDSVQLYSEESAARAERDTEGQIKMSHKYH